MRDQGRAKRQGAARPKIAATLGVGVALPGSLEDRIKEKHQLVIVPFGPLTALPFHLLVSGVSSSSRAFADHDEGRPERGIGMAWVGDIVHVRQHGAPQRLGAADGQIGF